MTSPVSKNFLITGAARGIGRGLSRLLLQKGHRVFMFDNNEVEVEHVKQQFEKLFPPSITNTSSSSPSPSPSLSATPSSSPSSSSTSASPSSATPTPTPGRWQIMQGDLTSPSDISLAADSASVFFDGRLDVLINNAAYTAGVGTGQGFGDVDLDVWNKSLQTNLTGAMLMSRECLPLLRYAGSSTYRAATEVATTGTGTGADAGTDTDAVAGGETGTDTDTGTETTSSPAQSQREATEKRATQKRAGEGEEQKGKPRDVPTTSSIINISSTRAHQSEPYSESYAATKAGLIGLTHAMAASLSADYESSLSSSSTSTPPVSLLKGRSGDSNNNNSNNNNSHDTATVPDANANANTNTNTNGQTRLGLRRVSVNVVLPGWIHVADECRDGDRDERRDDTAWSSGLSRDDHRWHWTGRVGRVEDVLRAVEYLVDAAEFVTGAEIVVDGGVSRRMVYPE